MKAVNTLVLPLFDLRIVSALFPLSRALKLKEKIVAAKPAKESAEAEKALLDAKRPWRRLSPRKISGKEERYEAITGTNETPV